RARPAAHLRSRRRRARDHRFRGWVCGCEWDQCDQPGTRSRIHPLRRHSAREHRSAPYTHAAPDADAARVADTDAPAADADAPAADAHTAPLAAGHDAARFDRAAADANPDSNADSD